MAAEPTESREPEKWPKPDKNNHRWFGAVCLECGTTFDRPEARQPCIPNGFNR